MRIYLGSTMTGTVNWQYVNINQTVMEYATPSGITPSGGRLVAAASVPSGAPVSIDLDHLGLRMEPGDVMVITATAVSSTASCSLSINWNKK